MSDEFNLIAEFREDQGKGASRRLRKQGKVPAILYGGGRQPRALMFDHNKVLKQLESEAFYSSILNVKVGDKNQQAVLKDVQRHPARREVLHMDLQRVVATEKIRMHVPLHFVGEAVAVGVKQGGGAVSHLMTDVEVSCLPKDLPEYIEVDVSNLALNEMIYMSDLKLPAGVEIPELAQGEGHDHAVVSIHVIKAATIEEGEGGVAPSEVPTAGAEKAGDSSES